MTKRQKKLRFWLGVVPLMAVLWFAFAPLKLGGWTSYIVISGNSMEPNFHFGDLVITRRQTAYQMGEAVAYYDPLLGGVIYHRIVEIVDDRYILQGDANAWLDSHEPTAEDVLGREWIYLPRMGNLVERARQPGWLGAILAVFVAMLVWPDRKQDDLDDGEPGDQAARGVKMSGKQQVQDYLVASLAAAGIGLLGFILFLFRPVEVTVDDFSSYKHTGEFTYSANSSEDVYPTGLAVTGDPIFRAASSAMTLNFRYQISGDQLEQVSGQYRLSMRVEDESGWRREIELIPLEEFTGDTLEITHKIWFTQVQTVIDKFEQAAQVRRGSYSLTIAPEIFVAEGLKDGLETTFTPELVFLYSPTEVQLTPISTENGLMQSEDVILTDQDSRPAAVQIGPISLPVNLGRWLMAILAIAGIGAAGYFYRQDLQFRTEPGLGGIMYEYGHLVVDLEETTPAGPMAPVAGLQDLILIAEKQRQPIFHITQGEVEQFFVKLPHETYLWTLRTGEDQ
jgi:signal peptidase I